MSDNRSKKVKPITRILLLLLVFLMVAGLATTTIYMIFEGIREANKTEDNKSGSTGSNVTQTEDDGHGHEEDEEHYH